MKKIQTNLKRMILMHILAILMVLGYMSTFVPMNAAPLSGGAGYTIQDTFPDSNLAQSVADEISGGDVTHVLTPIDIENLTVLMLNGRYQITDLTGISFMSNLRVLYVYQNWNLTVIPDEILDLTELRHLSVRYNNIQTIPNSLDTLNKLEYLDISSNSLSSFPTGLWNLKNLKYLDISNIGPNAQLLELPDVFASMPNLTEFHSSGHKLSWLPASFWGLNNLEKLSLDGNDFYVIPEEIGIFTKMTAVNLNRNHLSDLPESIWTLTNMQNLSLSENELTYLSGSIGNLVYLTDLKVSDNQLTSLPSEFGNLTNLYRLELWRNAIVSLPDSFGSLDSLGFLYLGSNKLTELPTTFGNLISLLEAYFSDNQIEHITDSIGDLPLIYTLDFGNNNLSDLPSTIGELDTLLNLVLSNNSLTSLPDSLWALSSLRELYLDNNNLTDIPSAISQMKSLELLGLSGNQLTQLPITIGEMPTLNELHLANNQLVSLPEEINYGSLIFLSIENNQLTNLPYRIVELDLTFMLVLYNGDNLFPAGNAEKLNQIFNTNLFWEHRQKELILTNEPTFTIETQDDFDAISYVDLLAFKSGETVSPMHHFEMVEFVNELGESVVLEDYFIDGKVIKGGSVFAHVRIKGTPGVLDLEDSMPTTAERVKLDFVLEKNETFDLVFDLNGGTGETPATQVLTEGSFALMPEVQSREGYRFVGWNTSKDGSGMTWDFVNMTMPASDVTLYAQWEEVAPSITVYTLTFNLNGGEGLVPEAQQLNVGHFAIKPQTPSRINHKFVGWNTSMDGSGMTWDFVNMKMPASDVVLYAQWKEVAPTITVYTLTFNLNGGEGLVPKAQQLNAGQFAIKPQTPSRTNHKFVGWNTSKDGSGDYWNFDQTLMPSDDITLYAIWEKENLPDTGVSSLNLVIGTSILLLGVMTLIASKKTQVK